MAEPAGAIFDHGYRHFEGARLGRRGAMAAVVREGLRRVLGLRRKARRKLLPWGLLVLAVMPAVALVGISVLIRQLPTQFELPSHGEYFDLTSVVSLLFMALVTPELLVPDRTQGVLAVYLSRPLRVADYLVAKAGALAVVVLGFYLFPQLLLYLGQAGLADGFFAYLAEHAEVLWQVPLVALLYFILHGSVALGVSAIFNRVGVAAGIYLALMIMSSVVAGGLTLATSIPGSRYAALAALEQHPRIMRDWVFGLEGNQYIVTEAGFGPGAAAAVIGATALLALVVLWWSYKRVEV